MSLDAQVRHGPLYGMLATLVATCGVLELMGLLRAHEDDAPLQADMLGAKPGERSWASPKVTLPVALALLSLGVLALPSESLVWVLTFALLALVPSALSRPSLFMFVAGSLIMLPTLGHYGLWDPWETHYGEVAREILSRDDWITLWWQSDEWFRSKPIFIFWIEALTWGAMGIPFAPDANPGHPEWALRLPMYLLSIGALMACYTAMSRIFGRRAGLLSGLVLATTPYFFFLSHQAITDMPFVATMTTALALLVIALEADPERPVQQRRLGPLLLSWQSVVIAAFVMVALPQILYLLSRNLTFVTTDSFGFWPHPDVFTYGSAGNGHVPGNNPIRLRDPYLRQLCAQPFAQGLLWLSGLVGLLAMLRRARDGQSLGMFGFYLFCSFAWMAKGIPGFALPGLVAALYLFATGRLPLLLSGRLRIAAGVLTILVTGFPWYVAMYGRLGPFFTDRLLIHDHINRLAQGVHGDTGSIQYFLWQLGYGVFPWIGLVPASFAAFIALGDQSTNEGRAERRTLILLALWVAAAFTLFSGMITKFHHYIFPAVPPMALLTGVLLDRMLGRDEAVPDGRTRLGIALAALSPLPMIVGFAGFWGDVRGVVPADAPAHELAMWSALHAWPTALCLGLIALSTALGLFAYGALRGTAGTRSADAAHKSPLFSAALVCSAIVMAFAGRDLSWTTTHRPLGHERLIGLFVYNYSRPFPEHLDYRPILTGFAIAAFAVTLLAALPKLRRLAVYGLVGTAFWFSLWSLDVYMIDLSPHWGQRELIKRYYAKRTSASEPLIAWQMNWKGENLYTGNRVHVFVQLDNKAIKEWLDDNQGKRAYFVLEHSRLRNFRNMMGKRTIEELSTLRENNKFILVRADI
jgi:4-amino-4-deoxy-L-arabinose transferase-like glycosyltransferase